MQHWEAVLVLAALVFMLCVIALVFRNRRLLIEKAIEHGNKRILEEIERNRLFMHLLKGLLATFIGICLLLADRFFQRITEDMELVGIVLIGVGVAEVVFFIIRRAHWRPWSE